LTVVFSICKLSTLRCDNETLSMVCHGNSVPGNMAIDICILKKINLTTSFV